MERLSRPTPSVAWSCPFGTRRHTRARLSDTLGADLVTPAGGVLINVPRRPAAAAHHLTLEPGYVATTDVQPYAIDTATGYTCPRWGNLVVTPPSD